MEIYTVASLPRGSIVLPCRDKPCKDKSVTVERDCKQWAAAQRSAAFTHSWAQHQQTVWSQKYPLACADLLKASHKTLRLSRCSDRREQGDKHPPRFTPAKKYIIWTKYSHFVQESTWKFQFHFVETDFKHVTVWTLVLRRMKLFS